MSSPPRPRATTSQRNAVWSSLCRAQIPALERGLCRDFVDGAARAGLDPTRAPRLAQLSARLHNTCGWRIELVDGLIPAAEVFALLRERRFPAPDWLRHPNDLEYTPEPDMFHDVFGHVPQLAAPRIAACIDAIADRAAPRHDGQDDERVVAAERLYWFTIEFGLVREGDTIRAWGAGLASSIAELDRALHAPDVTRSPFDADLAVSTPFTFDEQQTSYAVASSIETATASIAETAHALTFTPPRRRSSCTTS